MGPARSRATSRLHAMKRLIGVTAGVLALACAAFGVRAAPAGAATKNPCKVLTTGEIQTAFGGTVGAPKKGLSTPVSSQCEYKVAASADRPDGTLVVHVMTIGAKAAYTGLKKQGTIYVPLDGVPNSLYSDTLHVVNILKGSVMLGVQGSFVISTPLPIHFYDAKTQLTDLAQIGVKRV
jgi:hypothetical protein